MKQTQTASGRYRLAVCEAQTGNVVWQMEEWRPNIILNSGLDAVVDRPWADCFAWAVAGTGTTPNYYSSGTDGIAQSGTLLYQVGTNVLNFLTVLEVGDEIALSANSHRRVDGIYNGSEAWTTHDLWTTGSASYFIAKTNRTDLDNEIKWADQYIDGDGYCGTTIDLDQGTVTLRRSIIFTAETTPTTYTELGFNWAGPGNSLFSRVVFDNPVTVDTDYYLLAQYDLTVNYSPVDPTYLTAPFSGGGVGFNYGYIQHQNTSLSNVELSGTSSGTAAMDPYFTGLKGWISNSTMPIVATGSAIARDGDSFVANSMSYSNSSYISRDYYRTMTVVFGPADYNDYIRSLGWGGGNAPGGVEEQYFAYALVSSGTTPAKDSSQTFSVVFRQDWNQIFGA